MARKQRAKSLDQMQKTAADEEFDMSPEKYAQFESSKTSFFWTNDRFIESMDDKNIIEKIQTKYPALAPNKDEQEQKKQIVQLVNDKEFVEELFKWYSIDEFDLFKLMYQYFGNVFKGPFLKKIKLEMRDKTYATTTNRHIRKQKSKR